MIAGHHEPLLPVPKRRLLAWFGHVTHHHQCNPPGNIKGWAETEKNLRIITLNVDGDRENLRIMTLNVDEDRENLRMITLKGGQDVTVTHQTVFQKTESDVLICLPMKPS